MKKNKLKLLCTTLIISTALLAGCKDKDKKEEVTNDASINIETSTDMNASSSLNVVTKDGYVINELTGEWIDESLATQRPLCIMINNIVDAMPHSGISQADLTYEMLVEGSITRYMCVFKDYDNLGKVGPVRSSRHYYVEKAHMLGDLYAHYGWTSYAQVTIANLGVDNMNGIEGVGTVMYYRDESRYAPHNVYTNGEMINAGIDYMEYSRDYDDSFQKSFAFEYEEKSLGTGNVANKAIVPFNSYYQPWFEYDKDSKLYKRFQYGQEQIDDQTNEQLAYKNVLVIYADYTDIWDGLLEIDWTTGGTGFYFTNGEFMVINWKNDNGVVKYYDETGAQLKMNPGKTFIEVLDNEVSAGVVFE